MTTNNGDSTQPQCFIAMWFGSDTESIDQMNQLFELVIKPAVEKHNMFAYRIDQDASVNKIDEAILAEINRSVMMIVDLTHDRETGLRGSVIFEAGYGYQNADKPLIWMCRKDLGDDIPFDIRQFRQIRWDVNKLIDARKSLEEAIRLRLKERGKERERHELWGEFSRTKKRIEETSDLDDPTAGIKVGADNLRHVMFEEFCEDIVTRLKYKPMELDETERYELIDAFRGFKKILIDLLKSQNRVASLEGYEKQVWNKLKSMGWMR